MKKVILCGYGFAGCMALKLLIDKGYEVFLYTHEHPGHLANLVEYAEDSEINYSLEKIKRENYPFKPDLICSIYYRHIISADVIKSVDGRIFNLHPSLLPNYRGCSSLTWALFNGEKEVGYTYHYVEQGVDTGNILIQKAIDIYDFDTQETLYNRVMFESLNDFNEVCNLVLAGVPGKAQDSKFTYYPRGAPNNGEIDPNWDEAKIKRFIRSLKNSPYPLATYQDQEVSSYTEYLKLSKN
ncbi:Fmt Methionyl-tRNA formyltransferase [Burkholderiaceae bacterium]